MEKKIGIELDSQSVAAVYGIAMPDAIKGDELRGWLVAAYDGDRESLGKVAFCVTNALYVDYLHGESSNFPDDEVLFLLYLVEAASDDMVGLVKIVEKTVEKVALQFKSSQGFADYMMALVAKWAEPFRGNEDVGRKK